jgi:hypothetical protein
MADLSDVENGFVGFISNILYPSGPTQPSAVGATCRCYRGWPNNTTLNSDLSANIINVTVVSDNDSGRTTTRYQRRFDTVPTTPGVQAAATSHTVTVGGTPNAGDTIGILVDGAAFSYRVQAGDTPSLVASNLGAAIQAKRAVLVSNCTVSVPGSSSVIVRCVADSLATWEDRRQEKDIRVIAWCPSPESRDEVCGIVDGAFAASPFLQLADSTSARLQYKGTSVLDQAQSAMLFRRDLVFTVEYATVGTLVQPVMLFGASQLNATTTFG